MTFKQALLSVSLSAVALSATSALANRPTWRGAGEASWDNRFDSRFGKHDVSITRSAGEASWDSRFDKRSVNKSGKSFKGGRSESYDPRFGF